jgi:alkylation response protein AidB-like acyl-CoA dehydrogenase
VTDLLAWIAEGAAERERRDESPFAQVAAVAEAGLGALSLPVDEGGQGAGVRELFAFVIDLAEADPIVAHVLRTHYSQVLGFLRLPDPAVRSCSSTCTRWSRASCARWSPTRPASCARARRAAPATSTGTGANLRTITLHNPASYKAAAVGRHLVTGDPLPVNGYF